LKNNDVVYLGDIKSHDIVKGGKNHKLNRDMNDLKFYQLKQRMLYKASVYQKLVYLIPEPFTTKCCSTCGTLNHCVGSKEVFTCQSCHLTTGRDMNASKNIKMKGLFS
jgi:putative transposase